MTISDATSGATCYYTITAGTTGTTPTTSSIVYTNAISVTATSVVEALCTHSGDINSAVAMATLTVTPPVSVSVTPLSATLNSSQTQLFTATVSNTSNTAVTWTINPTGAGTISAAGLYTAPESIAAEQTVTVTATSQADNTKSALATVTLTPAPCISNGYSYQRSIVIDHTQVTNTDKANFPFLFNTTDPLLASTINGGHVSSAAGYDIFFSTEPTGTTKLDYEIETYNAATGQFAAWVRIPNLSHSSDTVLYMFYGNPAITSSQENATGVWDRNFSAVYHLQNTSLGVSVADSTANGNSGIAGNNGITLPTAATGVFGTGAGAFNGSQGIYLPSFSLSTFTVSAWIYPTVSGQTGAFFAGPIGAMESRIRQDNTLDLLREDLVDMGASSSSLTINAWNHAVISYDGSTASFYINGVPSGTNSNSQSFGSGNYFIGEAGNGENFIGNIDELHLSASLRSADWIATEYNNQSSPSKFSTLYPEDAETVVPTAVTLYGSQNQQFVIPDACTSAAAIWSMPSGSPGTLSANGLYTAPSSIETQQTVVITANTLGASSTSLTATVTLEPPVAVSVTPPSTILYGGQSQQFVSNVVNTTNTAVTWTISPAGTGTISTSGLYSAPASVTTQQTLTVAATSQADKTQSASATITLAPPAPVLSVSISVAPLSAVLYGGQTLQLTANVSNTSNTAVTWTISPEGTGTISATGLYTAPASVTTLQALTITATSEAVTTLSASATVTILPLPCGSNGYSYQRAIVIDYTQVPNTDQTNFPFLINTTDPVFASTGNGGHVTSSSGYDIAFSTNPSGLTTLNYEMEEYNPVTGQVIAWVRIPTLSHTTDTVIYVFYGNPNITSSQQNPTNVWDSNYGGVWHLEGNGSVQSFADSTANANTATVVGSASEIPGPIGNGVALSGSPNYIDAGNNPSVLPTHTGTFSIWVNYNAFGGLTTPMGNNDALWEVNGTSLSSASTGQVSFILGNNNWRDPESVLGSVFGGVLAIGHWYYLAGTWDGSTITLYNNGASIGSTAQTIDASPAYHLTLGVDGALEDTSFLNGSLDEARVSNIARSADWIATEYNNQSAPLTFYSLSPEYSFAVNPAAVALYAMQAQQFTATGVCNAAVTWSMPAGAPGTLSQSGLYTAPAIVTTQQTVTITATIQTVPSNTVTGTVTLLPSVAVSVAPANAMLTSDQTQQFTAVVANSSNQEVTWTINPAGVGTISAAGLYTAPETITTQQTVTITATSQEDNTKTATATITLSPTQCQSSGYGYQQVIVIDHTKVPNTDQTDFPFLFNTTNPNLATTANGGQVTSSSGYDIIFSSDPNGLTKLDHELEEYNPSTGQVIAWVRIPTLSHTTDTVIYMFYGNPNIASSQQNPAGVWNSNYQAIYHLANTSGATATDSTQYGNNASLTSVLPASGEIDGAAGFNGASSYIQIPSADFPNYPTGTYDNLGLSNTNEITSFSASFGVWFKTTSAGGILTQVPSQICLYVLGNCLVASTEPGDYDPAGWNPMLYIDDTGSLIGGGVTTSTAYNDNNWHFAVVTYATNGTDTLYVDGQNVGSAQGQIPAGYSPAYSYFVGTAYTFLTSEGNWNWLYFNGNLDEISVSKTSVSSDWVQTEYNNQGSPSTFYTLYPRSTAVVAPSTASLYASQSEQFAVTGTCNAGVSWSMQSGSPGTLTSGGLYTAPGIVTAQQTVTVTASSLASGTTIGSSSVTLLAPPPPITLTAAAQAPYTTGSSQAFTATLQDQDGTPEIGVAVTFTVTGANNSLGSGTTGSNGVASFTYTGANSGNDTIQATAVIDGQVLTSNSVSASWIIPTPPSPASSVNLVAPPALGLIGLIGAFTDNNGTVIEPIAIGAASRTFVVPTGATQLQLGVDSSYFVGDGGPGFVVAVNGASVTVPPTAMPWNWVSGGLNTNYQYGIFNPNIQNGVLDGTNPVVAATGLTQGESVNITYQSGTASANPPIRPLVNANGDQMWITGVRMWQGAYYPTLYTTASSYPLGQPITFNALVTDATNTPLPNVPVTLNITGANAQELQATTDSTGSATFMYSGVNAGTDTLEAQAFPSGGPSLASGQSNVTWVNISTPPPAGSIALTMFASVNDVQTYTVLVSDASGSPVPNANVGLYVWGVDNFQLSGPTDETGHAAFQYSHVNPGTYNVVAVDSVNRNVVFSNVISGVWTPPTTTSSCNNCNTVTVSISAQSIVTLPNTLQLNGTVTDNVGINPTIAWSQVSGPGTVTFATPQQAVTTATFSESGIYVVQLSASDSGNSASAQFQVTVNPVPITEVPQGWVGSPLYGSTVTGVVPITLAAGVTLQSGILTYYPTNNSNNITVLNANTTGSGQIGALDTTMLPNGPYWVQLHGTDAAGDSEYSLIQVTVAGNYKPGRVTATVTDLVVPATGLSINIQRQYDSLNAGTSSDFGYGWSLGINVNLTVDPAGNVTFTLGGQRRTFNLTPQLNTFIGFYAAAFTPEPGFYGTLTDSAPGCADDFDFMYPDGSLWFCADGGQYNPPGYIYTDPNGTSYTISAAGNLQSIQDRSGNGLTITANGITSTTGLSVPFLRDSNNRITQITDPRGNNYLYTYDDNGNLATVTYPNTTQPSTYTYDANHLYLSGTDARSNPLPTTAYYTAADTDPNGLPLNGRLQSVSDALGETTSYAYNLETNTTTVTYPPDASGNVGTATMVYDSYGMLLSSTDPLGHTTTNVYDANHNLTSVTDPLGHTNSYTYDQNGNKTSSTYPATATSTNTTSSTQYNQYSEPTSTTDELGNVRVFNYDANYNPQSVTDSAGTLASFIFNANQTLQAGAIGYYIGTNPAQASQFTYDANGNMASRTDALGRTTSYLYNLLGQKTAMVEPTPTTLTGGSASTTTYQYDALGNLLQTAAPLGRTTSSQYDANGNKTSDTDARGNVTTYQYDALNRLIETDYPDQSTKKRSFDFRNNVINETDQDGNVTVAVGTAITGRPPHRSPRAAFPHEAPIQDE